MPFGIQFTLLYSFQFLCNLVILRLQLVVKHCLLLVIVEFWFEIMSFPTRMKNTQHLP